MTDHHHLSYLSIHSTIDFGCVSCLRDDVMTGSPLGWVQQQQHIATDPLPPPPHTPSPVLFEAELQTSNDYQNTLKNVGSPTESLSASFPYP
jgi:hypothetical protein